MIEINLSGLLKAEKTVHVKGHQTKTGYVKPHIRTVKTAVDVHKEAAERTGAWIDAHPEKSRIVGVVNNYTVDEYEDINRFLRGDKPEDMTTEDINDSIVSISEFIREAPKFEGTVYRGMGFDGTNVTEKAIYDNFMSDVENNSTIILPSYTSTSCGRKIAMNLGGKGMPKYSSRIMLEIRSNKGVALDGAAAFPKEQEVLFDKNSEFKIISVNDVDGVKYIKLEELK